MSRPERIWWLSIILASVNILLVRCIHATEIASDVPNTTTQPSTDLEDNGNFEVLDMSQQQKSRGNNNLEVQTGQTTRILTSGEVDHNFWLKHLGEDFKYAIHLQVGDDSYNGVYNMSENGSSYDANHDYHIKEFPVDGKPKEDINPEESSFDYQSTNRTRQEANDYESSYQIAGRNRPLVKKQSASKKYNQNQLTQHTKYIKPMRIQNINIKHTHNAHKHNTEKQNHQEKFNTPEEENDNATSTDSWQKQSTPIVVTLPNDEKTVYHLADDETPVVVKMPPVIYHQEPTYSYASEESPTTNHTTHLQPSEQNPSTHNQYTSHQTQQSLQYKNTDFNQYNSMTSHSSGSTSHSPHSPHSLHSPYSSPMMPLPPSPYYNPSMLNEPPAYHSESVYSSSPPSETNANPIPSIKEQLHKSTDSVHFILRKPSIPYNSQMSHNRMPVENTF